MSKRNTLPVRLSYVATGLMCSAGFAALSGQLSAAPIGNTVVLAVTGDAAPNGNGIVSSIGPVKLNDAGVVTFIVDLTGTNSATQSDEAIFRGDSHSMVEIVRTGQTAASGAGTISDFSSLVLNATGQIAFDAILDSDSSKRALFRGDGQSLVEIAHSGQPAPDGDGIFSLFSGGLSLNDRGEVGFLARITESSDSARDGSGVFRADVTSITQLARTGQLTPSGNGRFSDFNNGRHPAINNSGQMAFFANLSGTLDGRNGSGMFRVDGTNVIEIVREDQIPPGGDSNPINAPRLNSAGELAFEVSFANSGIYRADASHLTRLVGKGEPTPDANGVIERFGLTALNDSGQIAFVADLQGTSGSSSDDFGIFRADGHTLTQVVREGELAPDGDGRFISAIGDPALNAGGQVAFRALVRSNNGILQRGVFLFDDAIGLVQVARAGDPLLGSTIAELQFAPGDASGHARGGFNYVGPASIAYRFTLLDGRQGVALWSIVPEPSSCTLVAVALSCTGVCRRRRFFSRRHCVFSP